MAKLSLTDKLAKKTFESAKFQQSWNVHMHTFGPILEPAFSENYQAKVHLTAALNLISSRQIAQAFQKLKQMDKFCETDADKTAFLFFMGVCFEFMGDREQMIDFYCAANEYEHNFYMPYIKVGKVFLSEHAYAPAYENYRAAIDCFTATGLSDQDKLILGAAYTNLATCLTMMHRYEEAEDALGTSTALCPNVPGRAAVEAALCALRGDRTAVETCLAALKEHSPEVHDAVKESTDKILSGTDPLFFTVPLEEEKMQAFWIWFWGYSQKLLSTLDAQQYAKALTPLGEKLLETFPFLEETPYIALGRNEKGYVLELKDGYAVAIAHAYGKLLDICPVEVLNIWQFSVVH
ncbi:MAG: tetratricopeptide repeat protein [Oscillospiraceae bacterium]|nr:tetratricopeptide repeat protein [Oscillospiraceae bacterium]